MFIFIISVAWHTEAVRGQLLGADSHLLLWVIRIELPLSWLVQQVPLLPPTFNIYDWYSLCCWVWLTHDCNPSTWEAVLGYIPSSKAIHAIWDPVLKKQNMTFLMLMCSYVFPNFISSRNPGWRMFSYVVWDKMAQGVMCYSLLPLNV